MTTKNNKTRVFDTMQQAASALTLPMREIKRAKSAGCTAFRGARVHESELVSWLAEHPAPDSGGDPKEEKLREEIRKLRIRNERDEGVLVPRAWVAERIQRIAGRLNTYRAKSEAEHPVRFAAAAGDVAGCRIVTREIWDEIMAMHAALALELAQ